MKTTNQNSGNYADLWRQNYSGKSHTYLPIALLMLLLTIATKLTMAPYTVTFVSPTLSGNLTVNFSWVYVNITASENLNASLLEWGNSSGFTNVSMVNVSLSNWFANMSGLSDGTYNYTVLTRSGDLPSWSRSERIFVTVDTNPPYELRACQELGIRDGSYVLTQNVSADGTCFTIKADNVTLDGQGHTITYAMGSEGYAVSDIGGYDNLTVRNVRTVQGSPEISLAHGIYASGMANGTLSDNAILTSTGSSSGIVLEYSSLNLVYGNSITTSGMEGDGMRLSYSENNTISGNVVVTSAGQADGFDFEYSSTGNVASNNTISSSADNAKSLDIEFSSDSNVFSNNTITSSGDYGSGVYVDTSASNAISDNTIVSSGYWGYGIYFYMSEANNVSGNAIETYGESGCGIHSDTSSSNAVSGNIITTHGVASDGIHAVSSDGNTMSDNALVTSGNMSQGISIEQSSYNYASGNRIVLSSDLSNGIETTQNAYLNTLKNNVIETFGSGSMGIRLEYSANSNTVSNNTITTWNNTNTTVSSGSIGIDIDQSSYNDVSNNRIVTHGDLSQGLDVDDDATMNTLANNVVETFGSGSMGIRVEYSANSNTVSNNTITTWNNTNTTVSSGSIGIDIDQSSYNDVSNNRIATFGNLSHGIEVDVNSNQNTIANNAMAAAGNGSHGINIAVSANSNVLSNNTAAAFGPNGAGINLFSSSSNNITGGSVTSRLYYDYVLRSAGTTNNFTATNFTSQRSIWLRDTTSWFKYNDDPAGNISLETRVSAASHMNRTLSSWSTTLLRWNDTNSTPGLTATYNISGLQASALYNVYNASGASGRENSYGLSTDGGGTLPSFAVLLNNNTEITVQPVATPTPTPTPATESARTGSGGGGGGGMALSAAPKTTLVSEIAGGALTKITVNLKAAVAAPEIAVATVTSVPVGTPVGAVYQYFEIKATGLIYTNIENTTIEFKVNRSWMAKNGIVGIYVARHDGKKWNRLKTESAKTTPEYATYVAYTPEFSIFAIVGETKSRTALSEQIARPTPAQTANESETAVEAPPSNNGAPALPAQHPEASLTTETTQWPVIFSSIVGPTGILLLAGLFLLAGAYYAYKRTLASKVRLQEKRPQQHAGHSGKGGLIGD